MKSQKVQATYPHRLHYQIKVFYSAVELWCQYDTTDVPTHIMDCRMSELTAIWFAAFTLGIDRWYRKKVSAIKTAWHILKGTDVPLRVGETRIERLARMIRGRVESR